MALFRKKAKETLKEKSQTSGVIMVSHELDQIREYCSSVVLIEDGKLRYFEDLEEGISVYTNQPKKEKGK